MNIMRNVRMSVRRLALAFLCVLLTRTLAEFNGVPAFAFQGTAKEYIRMNGRLVAIESSTTPGHTEFAMVVSEGGNLRWFVDVNGDGVWSPGGPDTTFLYGLSSDKPIVGDWDGTGVVRVGVYRGGHWELDKNNDRLFTPGTDYYYYFGDLQSIPMFADWNNTGQKRIGVVQRINLPPVGSEIPFLLAWYVDLNGDGIYSGPPVDTSFGFGGSSTATGLLYPVVGSWNQINANQYVGVVASVGTHLVWYVDRNGDWQYSDQPTDFSFGFGGPSTIPVVGDWGGTGRLKPGVFDPSSGYWHCDVDGNLLWNSPPDFSKLYNPVVSASPKFVVTGSWQ